MSTLLYKSVMFILGAIAMTFLVAAGIAMMFAGSNLRVCGLFAGMIVALIFMVMVSNKQRSKRVVPYRNESTQPRQLVSVYQPNDRPVMTYKGKVYDFVHNDPTAPDPA